MPTISMFYGIIIRMYNTNEHNPPHFHAFYGEEEAVFDFNGLLIKGKFSKRNIKLISAWCEIHYDELIANWTLAENGESLFKIEPLK